jgi:hypothetical protein
LTTQGPALSKSKAAIRFSKIPKYKAMKPPDHRLQGQIFYETVKLHRNTVNGGFPNRARTTPGSLARATQSCPQAIQLMANSRWCLSRAMPRFPPCLSQAVGGIFAPGGGRSGAEFQDVLRELAG